MTTRSVPVPAGAVVVGVDGSTLSDNALMWAAAQAERAGAPLHVVHAFVYIHAMGGVAVFDSRDPEELGGEVCADAAKKARAAHPDLPVTTEVRVGSAAPQLLKVAQDAGMVVLGARGHGRVTGALIGSVSQQVAMHASCPVVVVRSDGHAQGPVVVGVDGSSESIGALRFALHHAAALDTPLRVVRAEYVDPPDGDWHGHLVDPVQQITAHVRATVDEAAREYPDVDVDLRVLLRHPVTALVEESTDASLLVVASRGLGGFKGLFLGSVSQGVLSQAAASVAIVSDTGEHRVTSEQPEVSQGR